MKIVIMGRNGQVGSELLRALDGSSHTVVAFDRHGLDLAQPAQLRAAIREQRPDLIINAAAYTAVDKAESEPLLARAINTDAPAVMAEEARKLGAAIIHYSTDYVFDGAKQGAYVEDDPTNARSVYGQTKLAGEQAVAAACDAHWIWRTSWVYGVHGANFAKTMLRLAGERSVLRVVVDQFGAPTFARSIACATRDALDVCGAGCEFTAADAVQARNGVYHYTAAGRVSWHGYAQHVLMRAEQAGWPLQVRTADVEAIPATAYPVPAPRPANSSLSTTRFERSFGLKIAPWQEDLDRCLAELFAQHAKA